MSDMNIIKLAQECQLIGMRPHLDGIYQEALEKFAALVAIESYDKGVEDAKQEAIIALEKTVAVMVAQEREACADIAENWNSNGSPRVGVAAQIRARGNT